MQHLSVVIQRFKQGLALHTILPVGFLGFNNIAVTRSARRKTVSIAVLPNLTVKVVAPKKISDIQITEIITEKQNWINKKLAHLGQAKKIATIFDHIIDGQIFYYFGTQITIRITNKSEKTAVLNGNILGINSSHEMAYFVFHKWLAGNAQCFFQTRVQHCFEIFSQKFQYQFPVVKIRKMKRRWGSMSSHGIMVLNVCLILTPPECIDYVIMHELCHMKHANHGAQFHKLQEYFTPNYKDIKKKLAEFILT